MANTPVRDGAGNIVYLASEGTGTNADPYVQFHGYLAVTADASITGILTVGTAGTPVQGGTATNTNGFIVKAHPDNTDTVWTFFWGQTKASGFPLNPGEAIQLPVSSLAVMGFDADVSANKVCWIKA